MVSDVDVVFDTVGGYGLPSLQVLRPGGLLITAVERANAELAVAVEEAGFRFAGCRARQGSGVEVPDIVDALGEFQPSGVRW